MASDIKPIDPVGRAFFAGEVSGIDLTRTLSDAEVAAIHAGMDRVGVLVFHDQHLTDDQQLAFRAWLCQYMQFEFSDWHRDHAHRYRCRRL